MSPVTFSTTSRGDRELEKWLSRQPSFPRPRRDELLLYLAALCPVEGRRLQERLEREQDIQKRYLLRLVDRRAVIEREGPHRRPIAWLGFEAEIRHVQAHLEWLSCCEDLLADGVE